MKKTFTIIITIITIFTATITAGYSQQNLSFDDDKELFKYIELFSASIAFIRMHYIRKIEPRKLIYGALKGMLSSLDGYSMFLEPRDFREVKEDSSGSFVGVGIEIGKRDGLYKVISVLDNSPAQASGLLKDDILLKAGGTVLADLKMQEVVFLIKGKEGTELIVNVLREGWGKSKDIVIKRETITVKGLRNAYLIGNDIAYLELRRFQENSDIEIKEKIAELEVISGELQGLVLDLRDNGGGLLRQATAVANVFLDKGDLIVSIKARTKESSEDIYAQKPVFFKDKPIVVLVNGLSASASEIVAGAIRDNDRGMLVGAKTFGKGSVQTVIGLTDGSALKLTTAEYVTPKGSHIDGKGIVPDHIIEDQQEQMDLAVELIRRRGKVYG